MRVTQVSDLHLGAAGGPERRAAADAGWRMFVDRVTADPPELVVVTGDIVVDSPDDDRDQEYAQQHLGRLAVPTMILPGNHDLGDHTVRDGLPADWLGASVTPARVSAWEQRWGPGHQHRTLGDWTLIGLNSQIFGTSFPAEAAQWSWLEDTLAQARGTRIGVFMHESLHVRPEYATATPPSGWMAIPKPASERLVGLLREADTDFVAAGHTHRHAEWVGDGLRQITAPSLAGPIPVRADMTQAHGDERPGWLEYELTPDGARVVVHHTAAATRS